MRDAGAAFARATERHRNLILRLGEIGPVAPDVAGQVLVEGALLARYRYDVLKAKRTVEPIEALALVIEGRRSAAVRRGAARGVITAEATSIARDLANTPPALLTAIDMADFASRLGKERGLDVEIFDKPALIDLGCGGLLGRGRGERRAATMIKLTYPPPGARRSRCAGRQGDHVRLGRHRPQAGRYRPRRMKNDMSGAAATFAAMGVLARLGGQDGGLRLPHVHGQHARWHRDGPG